MASQINPSSMLTIATVLPALSIIAVCSRFYIRVAKKQGLAADDWLILPALFMVIGLGITIIIGVKQRAVGYPLGSNDQNFLNWELIFVGQLEFGVYLLSILNLGFSKLSLLYFYRRVFFTGANKRFDILTKTLAVIFSLWMVAMFFKTIFTCGTNVALQWGSYGEIQRLCSNTEATNFFWVSTDVLFDIILFVIPIPLILRLQLSSGRRLAILLVFAVGALALVTSIIRLVIFALIYSGGQVNNFVGGDPLIVLSLFFFWSIFECGIAVIVTCLPILQIWFRKASIEQIAKNVMGIFSVHSLSRRSHGSGSQTGVAKDGNSSVSNLNEQHDSVELDKYSQHSARV